MIMIAKLRAHIEANGGKVVGATTLTKSRDSDYIALTDATLRSLREKHGRVLEEFPQEKFGCGLEGLTEPEAGYLLRTAAIDAIRNRIAEAEEEGRGRGLRPASSQSLSPGSSGGRE
jgi:hypothetical protein